MKMVEKTKGNESLSEAEMLREGVHREASRLKKEVVSSTERKYKDPDLIEAKKIIETGGDTNKIKKLTPELVGDLANFYERQGGNLGRDKKSLDEKSFLSLNGLKTLDWETANALAFERWDSLELNGLTNVSPEIARALSRSKCMNLYLDGLMNINKEEAKQLSNYGGARLSLSGMKNMSRDVAAELGKFRGDVLILDGLVSISKEEAKQLSYLKSGLRLNGLKKIDKETARELSNIKSDLRLNGLKKIDKEMARELVKFKGHELELFGLTDIDEDVERILIKLGSRLHFPAGQRLKFMQNTIEKTGQEINWKGQRGNIEYDGSVIKSWGRMVNVDKISENNIKLGGLDVMLRLKGGLWLANFKNWLKKTYGNKKVEFKRDLVNKSFSLEKTFVVDDTMLITRGDLKGHIPECSRDEVMTKIVEWLNK